MGAINNDLESVKGFLEFIYDFYKSMKAHEIKLVYEGKVTHQITKAFIALAEAQMEESEEAAHVQRTVFHVMVECLQNISRHADEYEKKYMFSGRGIFLVSNTCDKYYITTGNVLLAEKVDVLKEMLEQINKLDLSQLKELYMKQMKEGRLSEKGGAGLGFIDIRRKTGEKLDYHFLPMDDKTSFFLLTAKINRNI